jgi:hypothetical protein
MSGNKSSISKSNSDTEIGEYWDEHDLGDVWEETKPIEIEVAIRSEKRYYPIERSLSEKLNELARVQGVSPETLINLWVQEKTGPSQR